MVLSVQEIDKSISDLILQRDAALQALKSQNLEAVEQVIQSYEQNIKVSENTKSEYLNGKASLTQEDVDHQVTGLLANEQNSVATELNTCKQKQQEIQKQIDSLTLSIDNAYVKAPISGVVNTIQDVAVGDYVAGGQQLLSIIPDAKESSYVVKSYIANGDIAKVDEGMTVQYEIAAYPSGEYGNIGGRVEFVSADLKVNDNGSAYYVIESTVNAGEYHNKSGDPVQLKVGMLCETKIVTDRKSVMRVLLDKMFDTK